MYDFIKWEDKTLYDTLVWFIGDAFKRFEWGSFVRAL